MAATVMASVGIKAEFEEHEARRCKIEECKLSWWGLYPQGQYGYAQVLS